MTLIGLTGVDGGGGEAFSLGSLGFWRFFWLTSASSAIIFADSFGVRDERLTGDGLSDILTFMGALPMISRAGFALKLRHRVRVLFDAAFRSHESRGSITRIPWPSARNERGHTLISRSLIPGELARNMRDGVNFLPAKS